MRWHLLLMISATMHVTAPAATLEWSRQYGTARDDASYDVDIDKFGNVYVVGFDELGSGGPCDPFVSKYDAAGTLLWTSKLSAFGPSADYGQGLAVDALGNIYISGFTTGTLGNPLPPQDTSAFVGKFDATGQLLWVRQLGTRVEEFCFSAATDNGGNVYIAGETMGLLGEQAWGSRDLFVAKYNTAGTLLWTRQLGSREYDSGGRVSTDGDGHVYVAGDCWGNYGGTSAGKYDSHVTKYDGDGTLLWTQQVGSSENEGCFASAAYRSGGVVIAGYTWGDLGGPSAGAADAYVSTFDADGTLMWTRQFGTAGRDYADGVTTDDYGNVYVTGYTESELGGPTAGGWDTYISKFDVTGALVWVHQLGTPRSDIGHDVEVDGRGSVYIAGETYGSLASENAGLWDAFLIKFHDPVVPEPNTLCLLTSAAAVVCLRRRWPQR